VGWAQRVGYRMAAGSGVAGMRRDGDGAGRNLSTYTYKPRLAITWVSVKMTRPLTLYLVSWLAELD